MGQGLMKEYPNFISIGSRRGYKFSWQKKKNADKPYNKKLKYYNNHDIGIIGIVLTKLGKVDNSIVLCFNGVDICVNSIRQV